MYLPKENWELDSPDKENPELFLVILAVLVPLNVAINLFAFKSANTDFFLYSFCGVSSAWAICAWDFNFNAYLGPIALIKSESKTRMRNVLLGGFFYVVITISTIGYYLLK